MYDLLIKNARLADGTQQDIAITHGIISAVGNIDDEATQRIDLKGRHFVSAGWIDGHTHCYPNSPIYHDQPDAIGVTGGVTTVVDAGSAGTDDIDDFATLAAQCQTNVRALLNISRIGLLRQNELADRRDIDAERNRAAIAKYADFIVGIKARMSGSVVGENGLTPLEDAKLLQYQCQHIPLMVHVGNAPPTLDEIVEKLGAGDILTHCFNGKPNRILTPEGELRDAVKAAIARGMTLDIGHGSASFSFEVAELAIARGILPDTISSDIYCKNRLNGPVYGLAHLMSMFLTLGLSHQAIIERVTTNVAKALKLNNKGTLAVGQDADLTLYDLESAEVTFTDTEGCSKQGQQRFTPLAAIVGGKLIVTEKGQDANVFNA
ncbi:Deacetylase [Vibrio stylophorae]|uniref:Deacetylase n=1 Tax=Vibrio stylophorae TaxID=659351 RepID=A0ABM8ZRP2_9VIBR|nr:amidohydrolase/deacetylase family metallohydrolase [Vibrio stylophorae]CAH0532775.1 Deacetylase [Vibrio stylophorae]